MNILKSTFTLVTATFFAASAVSQPVTQMTLQPDLYAGIEFKMPRVQEPVIPANSVSIMLLMLFQKKVAVKLLFRVEPG